jgi:hypothetical protein
VKELKNQTIYIASVSICFVFCLFYLSSGENRSGFKYEKSDEYQKSIDNYSKLATSKNITLAFFVSSLILICFFYRKETFSLLPAYSKSTTFKSTRPRAPPF